MSDEYSSEYSDDFLSDSYIDNEDIEEFDNLRASNDNPVHVKYQVLTSEDLNDRLSKAKESVAALLNLSPSTAATLLWGFKWHDGSLVERFMENPEKTSTVCGVLYNSETGSCVESTIKQASDEFMCPICCDTAKERRLRMNVVELGCNHTFCMNCYRKLVTLKIKEGDAVRIKCPAVGCNIILEESLIVKLIQSNEATLLRYQELIRQNYVADQDFMTWCPAPDCNCCIECQVRKSELENIVPTVHCKCGKSFCFGCGRDDHQPSICSLAKIWITKSEDESETANWMAANTNDCPKCETAIEKNGGCNHMSCRKCKYEFCWVCLGNWADHGNTYFNCSRYDADDKKERDTNQVKARNKLDRYLHYYSRYANHLHSLTLDHNTLLLVEKKMQAMQEGGMSWIEVQFLHQAYEILRQSRPALAWSYGLAFFLNPQSNSTQIYENLQKNLEMAVENLSEQIEKPPSELATQKTALLDKMSYVENRRDILIDYSLTCHADGTFVYLDSSETY